MTAFTDPRLTRATMANYVVRRAVLQAVREALPHFRGVLLDVGCGSMPYRDVVLAPGSGVTRYIGMDIPHGSYAGPWDLTWDGRRMPLADAEADSVMATEVLEHCPDPGAVLREVCRVLKPGGVFFFTVPFVWPLHDVPHDEYRYTPFALERLLTDAGLTCERIEALGGWDATLAQVLGLWTARRPMSLLAVPLIWFLTTHDHRGWPLGEGFLPTGFSGLARKPEGGGVL